MSSTSSKAISYAALILADEGLPLESDKLSALLSAAKVNVEPIWVSLFGKAFEGKDVKQLITAFGAGAGAPGAAAAPAAAVNGTGAAAEKEEKKKEEPEEESDDDMGFGLFD